MARLIDADALKKYMCFKCNDEYSDEPCEPSDCVFRNAIGDAPTVDAVEVVRCKDCKYKAERLYACTNVKLRGEIIHIWVEPDDFCSYGERKDDDS